MSARRLAGSTRRAALAALAALAVLVGALAASGCGGGRTAGAGSAADSAAAPAPVLELAAGDVASAARRVLAQQVAVSGSLVAVRSAVVNARVPAPVREVLVREGEPVRAGQRLLTLDDRETSWRLRQARDQAAAAAAQRDIAARAHDDQKALAAQGFVSTTALNNAAATLAAAEATLRAAQAAAELAAQAQSDTDVVAPLAGIVARRHVEPGERVAVNALLVAIVDLSRLELAAAVAPEDAARIAPGQTARLQVDGLDSALPARVLRLNPRAQPGTRSVTVYLEVDPGPGLGLRDGTFARGVVLTERQEVLAVPLSALRTESGSPQVLVLEDGRVRARSVQPGRRGEADFGRGAEAAVEISAGLEPGAVVLRASAGMLRDGTPAALAPPR